MDEQWGLIGPLIPHSPPVDNDRRTSMRAVVDAIFYINRGGCAWRMLPKDYPTWHKLCTAILLVGSMMALGKLFTMHFVVGFATTKEIAKSVAQPCSVAQTVA